MCMLDVDSVAPLVPEARRKANRSEQDISDVSGNFREFASYAHPSWLRLANFRRISGAADPALSDVCGVYVRGAISGEVLLRVYRGGQMGEPITWSNGAAQSSVLDEHRRTRRILLRLSRSLRPRACQAPSGPAGFEIVSLRPTVCQRVRVAPMFVQIRTSPC